MTNHLDTLVDRYLDLKDQAEQISAALDHVKDQIRECGIGQHSTSTGLKVTITAPARRFNATAAQKVLAPEVLELCKADGYDTKKLKAFLSPVLLDQCMTPGTGAPIVKVG